MKGLKPDRPVYWSSDTIAVANSADMWDTISKARIVRGDITSLGEKGVLLVNGEEIKCDALLTCTGWESTYPMFSIQQARDMGLPIKLADTDIAQEKEWKKSIAKANEEEVLERFPRLRVDPKYPERVQLTRSARLYRVYSPNEPGL